MKPRVVIYDFDGTLFRSPTKEEGEVLYFDSQGAFWPFAGWWGRIESLMPPIVPEVPDESMYIPETLAALREDAKDADTELVLMTGRPFKTRRRVQEILDHQKLVFHEYLYRGMKGQVGSDTLEIKSNMIKDRYLLGRKILEIWEDRPEHVSGFCNQARYWKSKVAMDLDQIIIHDISTGKKIVL